MRIKALSLWQPWASLITYDAKQIETRTWRAPQRLIGLRGFAVAIHATARFPREAQYLCLEEPFRTVLSGAGHPEPERTLPRGAVVAIAVVRDCVYTDDLLEFGIPQPLDPATLRRAAGRQKVSAQEQAFGDFSMGRWGWVLDQVRPLPEPYSCKGAQGLWSLDIPEEWLALPVIGGVA